MICRRCKKEFEPVNDRYKSCDECLRAKRNKRAVAKIKRECQDYSDRNKLLLYSGYSNYKEYLNSDLWQDIRRAVFKTKGQTCYLCNGFATQVHHNRYTYSNLCGKTIKHLVPICDECHNKIEFKDKSKTTVSQARREFKKIRKSVNS